MEKIWKNLKSWLKQCEKTTKLTLCSVTISKYYLADNGRTIENKQKNLCHIFIAKYNNT